MPNLGSVFKQEIARIARRETKSQIDAARKISAQHRKTLAQLRRQLTALERQVARLSAARQTEADTAESPATRIRFAPKGLRSLRERLGLSADRFARLLGVSAQSVYNWERRLSTPRSQQLQAIASLRGIGKREALARLEALDAPSGEPPVRAPRQRTRREKN